MVFGGVHTLSLLQKLNRKTIVLVILSCLWLPPSTFAAAIGGDAAGKGSEVAQLKRAKQLIKSGQSKEAYKTLLPLEDKYSGVPVYDYLLGVAALDSGNASYAVFALQRALMINDNFIGAKIDLGRAYYKLGEFDNAEREFSAVLKSKPSVKVSKVINNYLTRIKKGKPKVQRFSGQFILDTAAGFDSNANSASNENVFQDITLSDTSKQISSPYYLTGASANISYSILPTLVSYSSFNFRQRGNENASFIDSRNMTGLFGIRSMLGRHMFNFNGSYFRTYIAGNYTGDNKSSMLSWAWLTSKYFSISSFYQFSMVRATPENTITNTDSHTASLSLTVKPGVFGLPDINGAVIASKALALETGSPYGREMIGGSLNLSKSMPMRFNPQLFFISRALQNTYGGAFSGLERIDRQGFASLGVGITPIQNISLNLSLSYTRNFSTVAVYSYSRVDTLLGLKWVFLQ